jgi:hypothetical protein
MNLKDYAQYYIGCRCFNTWFPEGHEQYDFDWRLTAIDIDSVKPYRLDVQGGYTWTDSIKLILRRLDGMTENQMIGLLQSMVPADMEDKPVYGDYDLEMFYNDDGLMVDGDIAVGANYTCICFDGQIGIKKCGSIILFEQDEDVTRGHLVNTPMAFDYLLKQGFDLFGLIDAGLAFDINTLNI